MSIRILSERIQLKGNYSVLSNQNYSYVLTTYNTTDYSSRDTRSTNSNELFSPKPSCGLYTNWDRLLECSRLTRKKYHMYALSPNIKN